MPQRPIVRRRQKARRTKKLAAWREKKAAQQANQPPAKPEKGE
ncbi:MAG: hypothetical protein AAGA56_05280 [Myxococcota bacterium]